MTQSLPNAVLQFNRVVVDTEVLLSIARDSELQRRACTALEEQAQSLAIEKANAIANSDEDLANLLLGCECVNTSLLAELRMWLLLKQERPNEAWDQLVRAQESANSATRAHPSFAHLALHNEKLHAIEKLVFPPQVFMSSGLLARSQECSICGLEYGDCEHLLGMPYMGRFCYIVARQLTVDHVSVVDQPADKRCRVHSFAVDGGNRDRMTWTVSSIDRHDA